ncbi:DUF3089 domain-containing protein [uncultured Brevundimonas sp.]|uniref:DUF3089 domain-containing protein n=1 Tax=uncultured Brevundimonas sp. TaxID=213418 RepID=UPI0030ED329E|tara:strand:+ start:142 stop:1251 length:1110 start_codon:yes stop_codon:yes gene_type:complete
MRGPPLTLRQWVGWTGFALVFLLFAAVLVWRGDILKAGLDPQVPFQTYEPPPAPDYATPAAWALRDARTVDAGPAAVFFVHSTTYDGGREWNGPIGDRAADAYLNRVVLPNHAGPFARIGAISAPRYRQASLYTRLTLREDAREARAFAYGDIAAAFEVWLAANPRGPIVLAGVEQGGELLDRLVRERIAPDAAVRQRLVAVYLMDVIIAADGLSPRVPACTTRDQSGCVVSWSAVGRDDEGAARRRLRRALVWNARGQLVELNGRPSLCVNPVTGSTDTRPVAARRHKGATNATGLEQGARPALLAREVTTECRDGILRHSEPTQESFRERGSWSDRRKTRPYNLFYGDVEADVEARLAVWTRSNPGT